MRVLVFEVRGRRFALPAEAVRQVTEASTVTPLPFVPAYVEGLVAIGGTVIAQIDLGARLGLPDRSGDEQLIVAATNSGDVALRVGLIRTMATLCDADFVAAATDADAAADGSDSASAEAVEARFHHDGTTVFLLRPGRLGLDGATAATPSSPGGGHAFLNDEAADGQPSRGRGDDGDRATLACLTVMAGGQRCAFLLTRISGVHIDPGPEAVADAPPMVGGISRLRGVPRLALSLSELLGLPPTGIEARMVAATARGLPVAFQCDAVIGIRRFPRNCRDPAKDATGCIDSYLIDGDGRVTLLLDPDGLLADQDIEHLRSLLPAAPARRPECANAEVAATRRLLVVRAGDTVCGIDFGKVEQVADYTPPTALPETSALRAGMANVAGRILPVTDLGAAVGPAGGAPPNAYVVVRTGGAGAPGLWALAVSGVERPVSVPETSIRPAPVPGVLAAEGEAGERTIAILDLDALKAAA